MRQKENKFFIYKISLHERKLFNLYSSIQISESGCWEWTKAKDKDGYGITSLGKQYLGTDKKKNIRAHRLFYELIKGPIPKGLWILHSCDNPSCINLNHLFLGTSKDNAQDRDRKQRGANYFQSGENNKSSILTEKEVLEIRNMSKNGLRHCEISRILNVRPQLIGKIVRRERWKYI